jgi:ferritin-like metal-binding protein YciE
MVAMSLREVLIDELKDLYSAENQLVKALPKTAKGAQSPDLKQIFLTHLDETKGHVERLKQAFEILGKKPTGKHCSGMEGAIDEMKEALEEDAEGAVMDAGIIGAAARVEHYEIAGYSVAILMATALGEGEVVSLLKATLAEEQNAGKLVMGAAKGILRQAIADEGDDKSEPEKKPKTAKEKKSETDSKKDEKDASAEMGKSAEEAMKSAPAKKSPSKK